MVISSRAIVAVGLCAVGLGLLVGPSLGQQQDAGVRRDGQSLDGSARGSDHARDRDDRYGRRLQELR